MNLFVILIGVIELIFALLLSVVIMFLTFIFLNFITKKIDDIKEIKNNNYSVALYNSSVLFSVAWVSKSSISGAITSLSLLLRNPNLELVDIFKTCGIVVIQIIAAIIIAFSAVYFGLTLFTKLTKDIDEFALIKNNNISISILISTIVIIIALFIEPSVTTIIGGLVPYPSLIGTPS